MIQTPTAFAEFLGRRAEIPTFFEPLGGNNGDELIRMGAEHLMHKLSTRRVQSPGDAELIVINGGGGMNDIWQRGLDDFQRLRSNHPDTEIVIGPSSFYFEKTDFASLINAGRAPITIFCRERASEALLRDILPPGIVDTRLSHDIAFELLDSDWLGSVPRPASGSHVLITLREDREAMVGSRGVGIAARLPTPVRVPLKKLHALLKRRSSGSGVSRLVASRGDFGSLPVINADISTSVSFDRFVELIGSAALIVTDRLHVSILGCLLGRPVTLLPGAYHKIRGVYEFSMADAPHVELAEAS